MNIPSKLKAKVLGALPKSAHRQSRIFWQPTGIGQSHVLRVITPAWKSLPRYRRIDKLQRAIQPRLTNRELDRIFRISVLTTIEFNRLRKELGHIERLNNGTRRGQPSAKAP